MALNSEDKKDVSNHLGKALANRVSKVTRDKGFEHLVSARDSRSELRKEHNYWKAKKGKKNLRITSEPSGQGNYTSRIMVRKGH